MYTLQGVGVYGYKEVGFTVVCYIGTFVERYKDICLTCIDYSYIGTVLLYVASKSQCYVEVDVLLNRESTWCSAISAAVSRVDYECEFLICACYASHK